mmetsp:Transcript_17461/g.51050  ORF Transcript_17461/g.51050 Transcript_17461/m.51050 type:complete len:148 (+) Transcript_17461:147-590(+)
MPTEEEAELAVRSMLDGANYLFREGLELLGLPSEPMLLVRGKRLVLCGCEVRDLANDMIHAWKIEDKEEFYRRLRQLRDKLAEAAWQAEDGPYREEDEGELSGSGGHREEPEAGPEEEEAREATEQRGEEGSAEERPQQADHEAPGP